MLCGPSRSATLLTHLLFRSPRSVDSEAASAGPLLSPPSHDPRRDPCYQCILSWRASRFGSRPNRVARLLSLVVRAVPADAAGCRCTGGTRKSGSQGRHRPRPGLASRFGVTAVPCFVMVVDGKEVDRVVGGTTRARLEQMLRMAKSSAGNSVAQQRPGPQTLAATAPTAVRGRIARRRSAGDPAESAGTKSRTSWRATTRTRQRTTCDFGADDLAGSASAGARRGGHGDCQK